MSTHKLVTALASICLLFSPFLLLPTASTAAVADVNWPLWDNETPEPHTVFGSPKYKGDDPNHNITRKYVNGGAKSRRAALLKRGTYCLLTL